MRNVIMAGLSAVPIAMAVFPAGADNGQEQPDKNDQTEAAQKGDEKTTASPYPEGVGTPGHQRERLPKSDLECAFFRTIYDWRALDNYNLIVWFNSRNRPYLLELENYCHGLRFEDTIAFSSRDSRLCAFGGDAVIVNGHHCTIGRMSKLTQEQVKELVDISRKGGKKNENGEDK